MQSIKTKQKWGGIAMIQDWHYRYIMMRENLSDITFLNLECLCDMMQMEKCICMIS